MVTHNPFVKGICGTSTSRTMAPVVLVIELAVIQMTVEDNFYNPCRSCFFGFTRMPKNENNA